MRKKNNLLSLPGLILLVVLFAGLGAVLWRSGGLAFSPGALSARSRPGGEVQGYASHAEFEQECQLCHQPLKTRQAGLCLECHTGVARQLESGDGLHAKIERAEECYICHSDHRGREFDPLADALDRFDHSVTSFSLDWHQINYDATLMECEACHTLAPAFSLQLGACSECHAGHSPEFIQEHSRDFGPECTACHDGKDRMTGFDHSSTAFALEGKHGEASCAGCHSGGQFAGTAQECAACHAEPALHQGFFDLDCAACHTSQAWSPAQLDGATFDHASQTGFSLARHRQDYAGEPLACQGCHTRDLAALEMETCLNCHSTESPAFMEEHLARFGQDCLACHDGVDRLSDFQHADVFPLEGRHAEIECEACHAGQTFAGTPGECVQCHAEPEIHAGFFGTQCEYCHTASAWTPAQVRMHPFPLDHGGQGEVSCMTCHVDTYAEYTCYGCHDHQPEAIAASHRQAGISDEQLPDCAGCHPAGTIEDEGN